MAVEGGPKHGQGLGGGWSQCSGPTGLEKALGLWGVGLRLRQQKEPRGSPYPWSQRAGDLTWEPSRLPGLEWVGKRPSSPLLLLQSGRPPPTCLSQSPWSPSYAPRTHMAWMGLWSAGHWPGSSAGSAAQVGRAIASCFSSTLPRVPPTCLSWSPWPQEHQSCLASTSPLPSVPLCPTGSLWGSSHLLGRQSPAPAASRCASCGEMLTLHLPTLPSWLRLPSFHFSQCDVTDYKHKGFSSLSWTFTVILFLTFNFPILPITENLNKDDIDKLERSLDF